MVAILLPEVLNLGSCLTRYGLFALIDLIRTQGLLPRVTGLNLSDNQIDDEDLVALLAALAMGGVPSLRFLHLQYNRISMSGMEALAWALGQQQMLPCLEALYLQGNNVYEYGSLDDQTDAMRLVGEACRAREIALSLGV